METQNKTASEILNQAADILEYELKPWGKGSYFKNTDQGCSMCAHGAIAYCGNPEVKEKVDNNLAAVAASWSVEAAEAELAAVLGFGAAGVAVAGKGAALAKNQNLSVEDYIRKHYKGEVGLAHYKAAKVGLTFSYNDDPKTTKEDVITKLREAASS